MNAWFKAIMNSPPSTTTLIVMMVLFVVITVSVANAAVRPINPDLTIGTQTAKDAQQQRPACVEPHVYVLALKLPDGRKIAVKTIVVLKPC